MGTALALLAAAACSSAADSPQGGGGEPTSSPQPTAQPSPRATATATPVGTAPVLVGAGDIASCASTGDEATAGLMDAVFAGDVRGIVFTAGDNAYGSGTPAQFADCYEPSWGRHKATTRPVPGNHDYSTAGAGGYFGYFGEAAGDPVMGYYSYDLGDWHIVAINSNCGKLGGCESGSPQEQWLRADLAAHPARCTLAYWHHPRFSSGSHGDANFMRAIWQALYENGAEAAIAGHDHDYERFAPQDANGVADPERGIRQFVVGTGGMSFYSFPGPPPANSEARDDMSFGVLKLTLRPASFDWEYLPAAGSTFTDSGSQTCH